MIKVNKIAQASSSVFVLADVSDRSPQKLSIFIIKKRICVGSEHVKDILFYFENKITDHRSDVQATLLGKIVKLEGAEADEAAELMFARHPHMREWPALMHTWYVLELVIERAEVLAYFGGYASVSAEDYYAVNAPLKKR